ncbi:hypothetical protein ACFY9N_03980 [Microbacterium sp. NPDC008134]|uniref:hypothetical protein n=1 Tax=Microbacterium sp. NPDC008134 TaxID=3364183 RepID=UPI0036E162FF
MTEPHSPWAKAVGPCFTAASIARELGWTDEKVTAADTSLTLLGLDTAEGTRLFPAFQLWNGGPVPGLREVLEVLRTGTESRWTWVQWLNTALADDGTAHIERLRMGDLGGVLLEARHDAWAWSS